MCEELEFRISETFAEDVGKGWARLHPEEMNALHCVEGDMVEICGVGKTVARIGEAHAKRCENKIVHIDGITRDNCQSKLGEIVRIRKIDFKTAKTILISPVDPSANLPDQNELVRFSKILRDLPVTVGDKIMAPLIGVKDRYLKILATAPSGCVIVDQSTRFISKEPDAWTDVSEPLPYENVGGLDAELQLVREMVELPLRYSKAFEKLGIEPPKGVLLCGPPGTGKTLIARSVASETRLHFIRVNGPEIIHKFYGESEARLRAIFEEATNNAPSVIFIDEIDCIAPKRSDVLGDVEKRVVAQLLALMDGMVSRGQVVVIGATNVPEMIDPALRRPGRFDREVILPVPNAQGRREILRIHSRNMSLDVDVDLDQLANITYGFVGADLQALCKEAGMAALRRYLNLQGEHHLESIISADDQLYVQMQDFLKALREIEPTATREFYTEKSTTRWTHVGGLSSIKKRLVCAVEWQARYPKLFAAGKVFPPRRILFSGPSGTGKTLMAKALAGETGINFISIDGPILFSKWLGESERALSQVFKKAKQSAPCILFFDEIDALVPARNVLTVEGSSDRVSSQFFNELDRLSDQSQVIVLGATNRPDLLDPAVLRAGRFDTILEFPIPDEKQRLEIFEVHTRERPLAKDVDLTELARLTEGMVGSQIASVCNDAVILAITELIESSPESSHPELLVVARHFRGATDTRLRKERSRTC